MEKIRVLYIITKADIGGAQKYVSDLASNLDENRFETKILYGGKDLRWLSNKVSPWFLFFNDWLALYELTKILRNERPDIIHLNSSKAGVLGSVAAGICRIFGGRAEARSRPLKVIFTAHGWVFNPTNRLNSALRFFYIALHKLSAYFQDEIICVSEYDYQLASQYGIKPRGKLHMIHNGIDPNPEFLGKKEARKELLEKSEIEIPESAMKSFWIGSIGRLVKEKNYETLITAASNIPDAKFFLIGEGSEREKLKDQILNFKLQNRFFLINPSGEDSKYLKAFDVFAMSSIKEGLPYILLEAMAAELPIVVTETGGIPEMIKNHRNGMMVSRENPAQLAQAVSGLLANPQIAEELGRSARKSLIENFEIGKMISKTESVYENRTVRDQRENL